MIEKFLETAWKVLRTAVESSWKVRGNFLESAWKPGNEQGIGEMVDIEGRNVRWKRRTRKECMAKGYVPQTPGGFWLSQGTG